MIGDWNVSLTRSCGIFVGAGLFHVFFPHVAAVSIGWEVSPFQFEVVEWCRYRNRPDGDCIILAFLCHSRR